VKISTRTLGILKNFSNLSPGILVRPGNVLTACTRERNIFAEAVVEENFSVEFGIYDLNNFLSVVSLFKEAELDFHEKFLWVGSGKSRVKYLYCEPRMLEEVNNYSSKNIDFKDNFLSFKLLNENLVEIMKCSSLLEIGNILITSKDKNVLISVYDKKNKTANVFELDLPDAVVKASPNFTIEMDVENIKFLPGNYEVDVYQYPAQLESGIIRFKHASPLQYFVAAKNIGSY
jgi:hypothetical protein